MTEILELEISTDKNKLQLNKIYQFLSEEAYWSKGLPRETFDKAIANSICFGAYLENGEQVAFARVVTDQATFAYLADVFVTPAQRGKGISKNLMKAIDAHPDLQGLRRFMLATADAHELYKQFGFTPLSTPDRMMERHNKTVYQTS
ncbi:GCN5-related N-acetyltransferase [Pseudovibrio sp. FO-BEG1]|uniref:GNAT family N-acetyltransferase n=1 Tax=unclassified Pseudovibrio TaxID=2627060 RepID=UPI000186BEE6|nr:MULTISPECIES: GNAT family N-acetyltransferase [unclassified Pseudovibrio]AEV38721.1 GCN5-related N-acetyltransferase [Pseudovibrio sp. FO-BEG1]EEA95682.1 acetyltransferase, gnat family [Pseudovibrio sp. JE062]